MSQKLCECGCGLPVKSKGSRFRRGHSNYLPEIRQANSERMKRNNPMKDPEVSARRVATWHANGGSRIASEKMKQRHASGELHAPENTPTLREQNSQRMKQQNPMRDPAVAARVKATRRRTDAGAKARARLRGLWQDPDYRAAQVKRMKTRNPMFNSATVEKSLRKRSVQGAPSKMELWFLAVCKKKGLPIWYSGMGEYWVNGRNPDFKVHGRKLVIEITDGYTYRKQARTAENYAEPTIKHYQKAGYSCLVVMMPERRYKWKTPLQTSLTMAVSTFLATGQSAVWSFAG